MPLHTSLSTAATVRFPASRGWRVVPLLSPMSAGAASLRCTARRKSHRAGRKHGTEKGSLHKSRPSSSPPPPPPSPTAQSTTVSTLLTPATPPFHATPPEAPDGVSSSAQRPRSEGNPARVLKDMAPPPHSSASPTTGSAFSALPMQATAQDYRALILDLLLYRRESLEPVVRALQKERLLLEAQMQRLNTQVGQLVSLREEIRHMVEAHRSPSVETTNASTQDEVRADREEPRKVEVTPPAKSHSNDVNDDEEIVF